MASFVAAVTLQSCAAWSERYRTVITDAVLRHTRCSSVTWRPAAGILKEEGIELPPVQDELLTSTAENSLGSFISPMSSQVEEEVTPAGDNAFEVQQQQQQQQQQHRHSSRREQMLAEAVQVREAGVGFLATPESGQKTGFYADQRHNRAFIASMAAGKTVLDLCCYSGGFGIMAAAAGAAAVTGVDSSAAAVELATANAELNGLDGRWVYWL
jgi:23S rRNA G2069 N7-methylase RlmK/C1962 C5-methylase RlmI